jgi:thiosulfate dehydrogenase [quinone] large subunit
MTRTRLAHLDPGLALLPLRLFLGVTFVYGGIQKLADPGFFHPGAPTYIGTQLHDFASGTPGGFVLRALALPHAQLAGAGVALAEIAIGLLVLSGLLTRWAALAGLGLNLLLFLTASWKTYPYFLGSDIVFVFAWLPFVLAGATGQPALDHVLRRRARSDDPAGGGDGATRRELLGGALGATAVAALGIAGLATLTRGGGRPAPKRGSGPGGAVAIAAAGALAPGHAVSYTDPADGQPDLLIRQPDGNLTAMSAVCTHAGCKVGYADGAVRCPCHGSVFNAQTGAVVQGPAPTALPLRKVVERGGKVYAVES